MADVTPAQRPVFIIGCGRSGTTLLFQIMRAHRELVATTGHPDGEDHVGWTTHSDAIISGIYGNLDTGDLGSVVGHACCLPMAAKHAQDDARARMQRYYSEDVLGGASTGRVLNKCPHLSNKLGYVQALFPHARFIHLIRDPVAMSASWVNIMNDVSGLALYLPPGERACFWVMPRRGGVLRDDILGDAGNIYPGADASFFGDYWSVTNDRMAEQVDDPDRTLLTVRYEDLIADPDSTLATITDFCDLGRFETVPVSIDRQRNTMRSDLLSDVEVSKIRTRTAQVRGQFGYGD